jgi:two-component system cell cycle response regulator
MSRHRILIVEDDADLRRGMSIRLKANDYDTLLAADGLQAVSVAEAERPDLILLDLGLPDGDGFTVMENLRKRRATETIPIVVVTGRDAVARRDRVLELGAAALLTKPVDNEELLGTIRAELGE